MPKFCNNGHQMEDSWDLCPYCQRTGFQNASNSPGAAKTRLEFDGPPPAQTNPGPSTVPPPLPGGTRKTILLGQRPHASLVGWLVGLSGEQKGEDFRIREGQNSIGSSPGNDIVIPDPAVSGKHAILRFKDQKYVLTDLDSTNGTFLNTNSEPIAKEELHDNDTVRFGNVSFKFKSL